MRSMRDEQSVYTEVLDQAKALTSLHDKPLVVVTTSESLEQIKGWSDAQDRLAALSPSSPHRVADAIHEGSIDDQVMFQPSVTAIRDVVLAGRSDEPVVSR